MNSLIARRGPLFFSSVVLTGLIALVLLFSTGEVAKAKGGGDLMVSSSGQTLEAPDFDGPLPVPFAGTGQPNVLETEDEFGDQTRPVGMPGLLPGSLIGPDGRTQVLNTKVKPYRMNAFLEVDFPASLGTCTGWFIGPRTLMTAGHCVYNTSQNKWATKIAVYPGRNGSKSPYGAAYACALWSVRGWVESESIEYDYGAIMLASTKALGNTVGWYSFFWTGIDASLDEDVVRIFGYPGDKPYGTQWGMKGRIKQVAARRLFHNLDTMGGQSGSAVYETRTSGPYANSIHTYAAGGGTKFNSSTRITKGVYDNMIYWKNNPNCN